MPKPFEAPGNEPIRRRVVDMITFRSIDIIRGRLFGTGGRPDRKLHSRTKKSRLGEPSKQFMREALMRFRKVLFRRTVQDTLARFREELQQATVAELHRSVKAREGDLRAALARHESDLRRQHAVLDPLEELRTRSADVATRVHALTVQFAKIDPEVLLQPVERKPAQEASAESEADRTRRARRRSEREQEA